MKVFLIVFAAALAASHAVSSPELVLNEWETFKIEHEKSYASDVEDKFRMKIFMDNRQMIAEHNAKYDKGLVSFKLKLNQFGDLLHHEFESMYNGFKETGNMLMRTFEGPDGIEYIPPANVQLPESVDWRTDGAVTAVKNQGDCSSCWAFSATGALEGQHFRSTGVLVSLSEQNLIDCSGKYGNIGCKGGSFRRSFKYIKYNNGLDTEESYPYKAKDGVCRYKPKKRGATDAGFVNIPRGDEEKLKAAVATVGPVSVSIDASHDSFRFYSEGVYYEPECSDEKVHHAVLAVGYGTDENGQEYWLVKNSWTEKWGDKGYIKMARNADNHCGIAKRASYPLV